MGQDSFNIYSMLYMLLAMGVKLAHITPSCKSCKVSSRYIELAAL